MVEDQTMSVTWSLSVEALATALSLAQGEFSDAKKDAKNPHFKNTYATLASTRDAVQPSLTKHGLSIVQCFEPHGTENVCVVTLLLHKSGQWIKSCLVLPITKKDAQGFGSAISYGRRYSLQAICGIATDDDDAQSAVATSASPPNGTTKPAPPAGSDVDVDALCAAMATAAGEEDLAKAILAVGRVKEKLTKEQLKRCTDARDTRVRELGV